ncbi:glycosyltransferase family 39 protein [Pseudobutyrivibrio sp.]|uniref:glycosyltransferase family 39 protein n=1 Tax=Pseudobutyrivibrio sp. TaxID=2014367 RepID=UPI001D2B959E|nr:hypothetical protein [Pseudobutyrivibrio sp.]MBE5910015.1 glycosyltransferase family 39 protein [Pseudobutyrivibrio sp.]
MVGFFENKKNFILAIIGIGVLIWSFFTLNCGYYVDENGLLVIYKGIYQGQHMFTDSWEALQTGGILAWPLLALYYQVFSPMFAAGGINIGLVLFMRICYVICRLMVAGYLYYTIKRTDFEKGAYLSALFYYMFVVVWRNFSYKSYCEMAVMLLICFLVRYHETRKNYFFVLAAVATCIAILAYPTMIIMAVLIGVLLVVGIYRNEFDIKPLLCFSVTCVVIGGAFALYLQFTSGWGNIISQISNLGDQDYEHPMWYRLGVMLGSYVVFAVIAYLPILAVVLIRRFRYLSSVMENTFLTIYWIVFFLAICVLRPEGISTSRFVYAILILFFWFPYLVAEKEDSGYTKIGAYNSGRREAKTILWIAFIISAATQLIWAVSTNQDITVPGHMAVYVVIADLLIMLNEKEAFGGLVTAILAVAAFFMGFWVPEHNGGYSDVLATRYIVTEGELKGIALLPEDYQKNQICYELVTQYIPEGSKLLVAFGSNSTGYINSDSWQGTYTVYARTQKNTKLLDYYQINPDNQADYLLLDKGNDKYEMFLEGDTGKYLMSTYTNEIAYGGDFVLLGR